MKESFLFSFSHQSDSSLLYFANFILPNKLRVDKKKKTERTTLEKLYARGPQSLQESFEGEKAWEVFRKNATCDDVLMGSMQVDFDKRIKHLMENPLRLSEKDFLVFIRQRPRLLKIDEVRDRFIRTLEMANAPYNVTHQDFKGVLEKYLIPRHPEWKKTPPEVKFKFELLRHLTKYLSEESVNFLKEKGLWTDKKDALTDAWKENYQALQKGLQDKRIRLNSDNLRALISNPAGYAYQILKHHYPYLSRRSFFPKRKIKKV